MPAEANPGPASCRTAARRHSFVRMSNFDVVVGRCGGGGVGGGNSSCPFCLSSHCSYSAVLLDVTCELDQSVGQPFCDLVTLQRSH